MKPVKSFLSILSCAIVFMSLTASAGTAADKNIRKKLKTIIIPKISFQDTPISTVIAYLKQVSREQDPDGAGVNFMLILKPQKKAVKVEKGDDEGEKAKTTEVKSEPTVTLDMDDLPLGDAVRFITMQAGMTHVVESHAVIVMDKDVTRKKMEFRVFDVDPAVFRNVEDIKKYFEERGVDFPTSVK